MSAQRLVAKLRKALESTGIPWMVTGSFASAAHGIPRATNDIDVVIAPSEQQLIALFEHFPASEYYSDVEHALAAGIIAIQATNLDVAYVEKWVSALGLDEQWKAALKQAT